MFLYDQLIILFILFFSYTYILFHKTILCYSHTKYKIYGNNTSIDLMLHMTKEK